MSFHTAGPNEALVPSLAQPVTAAVLTPMRLPGLVRMLPSHSQASAWRPSLQASLGSDPSTVSRRLRCKRYCPMQLAELSLVGRLAASALT